MVEYGLSVGKAGVKGVGTKGVFDKVGATLGKAADIKPGAAVSAVDAEAARNREILAGQAGEKSAALIVKVPDGMVVSVEQQVVGRGPVTVKLAPGKYKVRVAGPGYAAWEEQIELAERENRELAPALERPKTTANVIQIRPGARQN
jgi:hypothetical protein